MTKRTRELAQHADASKRRDIVKAESETAKAKICEHGASKKSGSVRVKSDDGVEKWFQSNFRCALPCEDPYFGPLLESSIFAQKEFGESWAKALYPGSFIHVVPSLLVKQVVYVDNFTGQKKVQQKFFSEERRKDVIDALLENGRQYEEVPSLRYLNEDFTRDSLLPGEEGSFDLLISLNAGGKISMCLKDYVKPNGFLFVNDSFGDASLAYSQTDTWKLVGAYPSHTTGMSAAGSGGGATLHTSEEALNQFFVSKRTKSRVSPSEAARNFGLSFSKRPVRFTHDAFVYLFKKVASG